MTTTARTDRSAPSARQLEALAPAWARLWHNIPDATPFQSPEWLLPWWREFGSGELELIRVPSDDGLGALVPLEIHCEPASGERQVLLLGTGNSDWLDGLYADRIPVAEAVGRHLARLSDRWDVVELRQLPPDSALLRLAVGEHWEAVETADQPCPVLTLPPEIRRLEDVVPAGQCRRYRYYRRRLDRLGTVELERADRGSLPELFDSLVALHQRRWAGSREPGVLSQPGVVRFLRDTTERHLAAGRLRLSGLRLNGRLIAALLGLADRRRIGYYIGGFDPEFERYNVGATLIGWAIEEAIAEGRSAFDFLRGRERYKYAWGAVDQPTRRLRIRRAGGTGRPK